MKTTSSLTAPRPPSQSPDIDQQIRQQLLECGGWMGFDSFMALALYAPGLGYYARGTPVFGQLPQGVRDKEGGLQGAGSDFVTAPEMSALFGQALARQVAQALAATGTDEIWEFGAGSGALALQLLDALHALGVAVKRYTIVDLSATLRARQQATLQAHVAKLHWANSLPETLTGVVLGNEVLDAMPVKLLVRLQGVWHERGVVWHGDTAGAGQWVWADKATDLRPPVEISGAHDYLTEIHPQAEGFVRTLAHHLVRGAVFLLDYGYPEAEYYHEQRHMGTVMCHRSHQVDANPLVDVGSKDITAHINFTGIALAAQEAGLEVLGYTNQAHFLMNCGLLDLMQSASRAERITAQRLVLEHEMGEFFKVIGLGKGPSWEAIGFAHGDKTHRL